MSRTAPVLLLTMLFVATAFPQEKALAPSFTVKGRIVRDLPRGGTIPVAAHLPLGAALDLLPTAESRGTKLNLTLPATSSPASQALAREVEVLWNANKPSDAILRYASLCEVVDPRSIEAGITYGPSQAVSGLFRVAADVPVGPTTDSVRIVGLATDVTNGNLFIVTLADRDFNGSIQSHWTFYASTNGGADWNKIYTWNAGYPINSISMAVVHNYCYVGFSRASDQTQVLVYRFSTLDGSQARFADSSLYETVLLTTSPESVQEVFMFSNHESFDNRLYCAALTSEGFIKTRWNIADSVQWGGMLSDIGGALAGVSATYNATPGSDSHYWIAYVDTANTLCVDSAGGSSFYHSCTVPGADFYSTPSIGAYKDTVFCASEMGLYIVYLIRYGTGGSWYWGYAPDTTLAAEQAVVTMSRGNGIGMAYRYYTDLREGLFTWREISTPGWTSSVKFTEHEEFYVPVGMKDLGNGTYGIVYVSWDDASFLEAFYATVSLGVTGATLPPTAVPERVALDQNYPNPFNPSTTIRYRLASSGPVRLCVYNALGQEVAVLFEGVAAAGEHSVRWDGENAASGAYYVRLVAGDQSLTRMMLLVK
jgi:hypothetical protein